MSERRELNPCEVNSYLLKRIEQPEAVSEAVLDRLEEDVLVEGTVVGSPVVGSPVVGRPVGDSPVGDSRFAVGTQLLQHCHQQLWECCKVVASQLKE